jgi:hypothetical protein
LPAESLGYFDAVDSELRGTKEHFGQAIRASQMEMLDACNGPVKIRSGVTWTKVSDVGDTHERSDGRRDHALDRAAEVSTRTGDP